MYSYNIFFENIFWGYAWADSGLDAIKKVAGKYTFDENGNIDYRWRAELY